MPVSLPGESWASLCKRVARAHSPVTWSWAAARTNTGEWQLLAVCLRGATTASDCNLRYESVVVRSETISPRAAASRLRRGTVGARGKLAAALRFAPDNGQVFGQWSFSNDRMYLRATPWAHYYAHQRLGEGSISGDRLYEPLIARGQPYFPSLTPALASIVFGVAPTALQNHTNTTLMVQLPDTRGRITSLQARDGQIVVGLVPAHGRVAGITVHAAWRSDPGNPVWHHHTIADPGDVGEIAVPTDGVPAEMSVVLLAPGGALLDQRGWSEQFGQPPADDADLQGLATRWLAEGESATVEFKQDLNSDSVRRSFAETIAAFANGIGGVILVGVTDDAQIVGYKTDKTADQITNIARNLVVEPVTVQTHEITLGDGYIQVVVVPSGDPHRKPYRCRDRVMVRANATTRPATTFEIRAFSSQGQPTSSSPLVPRR
jgi:hypothetical protein